MNETAKNEMRNYLSAAGFFVLALSALIVSMSSLFQIVATATFDAGIACSLLILLFGILLAVLGKRDLTAITFLMFGSIKLLMTTTNIIGGTSSALSESYFVSVILQVFLLI